MHEAPTAETPPRRGRPRPTDVIARDEDVYQLLTDSPRTRNQIAAELGLTPSLAYLAIDRLRRAGRIRPCCNDNAATLIWTVRDGTPCP